MNSKFFDDASAKGTYVNIDADIFAYLWYGCKGDFSNIEKKLELYIEGYKGHGIHDLMFCVLCQSSVIPSEHIGFSRDAYNRKWENGREVDYTSESHIRATNEIYSRIDDPYAYMIELARRAGIRPWLSYRMNDCHHSHAEVAAFRCDEIYYTAKRNGWFIGDHVAGEYYGECIDYSVEYFRNLHLKYIRESLEKYDVYGIELDFLREIFCFDYLARNDCAEIMTDFIREVRRITDEIGERRGHKIKLLVRVVRDIENNLIFGFDVRRWAELGLVDIISPCSRWQTTDSDMPISDWCDMLKPYGVEVLAGLEYFLWDRIAVDDDSMRALTAQYIDDGADGIYLYNYYREAVLLPDMSKWYLENPDFTISAEGATATLSEREKRLWEGPDLAAIDARKVPMWEIAADPDNSRNGVRRHVMTFTEPSLVPKGGNAYRPLPVRIAGELTLEKMTGNTEGREVVLYIGLHKGDKLPTVTVDGAPAEYIGTTVDSYIQNPVDEGNISKSYAEFCYHAYKVAPSAAVRRKITFRSAEATLEYLEIKVESKN